MPFDSSNQGEYLTSQWLQKYFPHMSQAVREKYERGFNLRKIRDPQTYDFPIVQSQNRGGPLSLPQPVNYAAPTVATSYMGHGLGSGGGAPFSGGSGHRSTLPSGTVLQSEDHVSTASPTSSITTATAGSTTGGGNTDSGVSTEPSGTSVVIITTAHSADPPTDYPSDSDSQPVHPPTSVSAIPSGSDVAQNFCGSVDCQPEFPGAISMIIDQADGHLLTQGVCPSGHIFYEAGSGDVLVYVYSDPCECWGKDAVCPPSDQGDCWGIALACFRQRDEYNLDNVLVDSVRGAFEKITDLTNVCVEGGC